MNLDDCRCRVCGARADRVLQLGQGFYAVCKKHEDDPEYKRIEKHIKK